MQKETRRDRACMHTPLLKIALGPTNLSEMYQERAEGTTGHIKKKSTTTAHESYTSGLNAL